MELMIALIAGAAGGSMVCGISARISISAWISLLGGMVGGGVLYACIAFIFMPGGAKMAATADLMSFVVLMLVGVAGGALALTPLVLFKLRKR
ncbi:MAG: hypothetical protein JKY31_02955 [Rhodobacteraceae bacterium]|nr:hypothetical protein [Paracoccaceae bacterium]